MAFLFVLCYCRAIARILKQLWLIGLTGRCRLNVVRIDRRVAGCASDYSKDHPSFEHALRDAHLYATYIAIRSEAQPLTLVNGSAICGGYVFRYSSVWGTAQVEDMAGTIVARKPETVHAAEWLEHMHACLMIEMFTGEIPAWRGC